MANFVLAVIILCLMSATTAFSFGFTCDILTIARIFCGVVVSCVAVYAIGFIIGYSTLSAKRLFITYGFGKNNKEA